MLKSSIISSPVGPLRLVASERGLRSLYWAREPEERVAFADAPEDADHPILKHALAELDQYFAGRRRIFGVALDPVGTPFQLRVWQALRDIPYGETRSYGEQARMIGQPQASRATGAANGQNPIAIIVPCHRVVSKSGALTGFSGGLSTKQQLLEIEGALVS